MTVTGTRTTQPRGPRPNPHRHLVDALDTAIDNYEQAAADPMGEANEAAQEVADACVALRKARGWVTR